MASTPIHSMGDINPSFLKRFTYAQIEDKVNARRDTVPEYYDLLMQSKVGEDKDGAIFDSSHPSWNKLIVTVRERERAKTNGTLMLSPISLITVPVLNGPVCTNVQQQQQQQQQQHTEKIDTISISNSNNNNINKEEVCKSSITMQEEFHEGGLGHECMTDDDEEKEDSQTDEDEDEEEKCAAPSMLSQRQFIEPVSMSQPSLDVIASFVSELFIVNHAYVDGHLEFFALYTTYIQLRKIFHDLDDWWTLPQYIDFAAYCMTVFNTYEVFTNNFITSLHFVYDLTVFARCMPLTPSIVPICYLPKVQVNMESLSKLAQKNDLPNSLRFLIWQSLITSNPWSTQARDKYNAVVHKIRANINDLVDTVETHVYLGEQENGLLQQRKEEVAKNTSMTDPNMYPNNIQTDLTFDICNMDTSKLSSVALSSARVISVDVVRTLSSVMLFTDTSVRRIVGDLLMKYCLSANIEYKQGLNYILAPLLFVRFPLYTQIGDNTSDESLPMLPLDSVDVLTSNFTGCTRESMHYIPSVVASLQCESDEMVDLLDNLLKHIVPNLYDDNEFYSLQCHFVLFRLLLQYHDAPMSIHLDSNDIGPELYSSPWLLTIHVNKAKRYDALLAVWDKLCAYFVYDNLLHVYISLALMISNREAILATKDVFLPEVLSSLVIVSPDHAQVLLEMALDLRENTPASVCQLLRQISTEYYRPGKHDAKQSEQSRTELRLLQSLPVIYMSTEELVAQCYSMSNSSNNSYARYCILDTRTKREYNLGHLPNSANIDPTMLANLSELTPYLAQLSSNFDQGVVSSSHIQHSHNTHFIVIYSTERAFNVRNALSLCYILLSMGCSHVSFGQWGYDQIHDYCLTKNHKLANHTMQMCDVCMRKSRQISLKNGNGRRGEAPDLPGQMFASDHINNVSDVENSSTYNTNNNTNDEASEYEVISTTLMKPLPPQVQMSNNPLDDDFEIMNVDIFQKDKSGRCSLVLYPDLLALEETGTAVNPVHIMEITKYMGKLAQCAENEREKLASNGNKGKDGKKNRFFSNVGFKASNVLTSMRSKLFKEGSSNSGVNTPEDSYTMSSISPPVINLDISAVPGTSSNVPVAPLTQRLENCMLHNPYNNLLFISAYSNLRNFHVDGSILRNSVGICITELITKALTLHSQPTAIARKKGNTYATHELANMLSKEELWKLQRVETMNPYISTALDCDNISHYLGVKTMKDVTVLSLARNQVKYYLKTTQLGKGKYHIEDLPKDVVSVMQERQGEYHGVITSSKQDAQYIYGYRQADVYNIMISKVVESLQGIININSGYIELANTNTFIPTTNTEEYTNQLTMLNMLPKSCIPPMINDSHSILLFTPVLDTTALPDISPAIEQLLELDISLDRVQFICFITTKDFLHKLAQRWPTLKVITLNIDKIDTNIAQIIQNQPLRVEEPNVTETILTSMTGVLGFECYPHIVPGINELSRRYFGNEPI